MPKLALTSLLSFILSLSAQAHDLELGHFDTSSIRQDFIDFVGEQALLAVDHPTGIQTAEELELQSWVDSLINHPRNRPFFDGKPIEVRILENVGINAYASPHKKIIVGRGLIAAFEGNPLLLKGPLAHELAHLSRAHALRSFSKTFAGAPECDLKNFQATWSVRKKVFAKLTSAHQSRSFELEADHIAMELLNNAGMDPMLLPVSLQHMEQYKIDPWALPRIFGKPTLKVKILQAGVNAVAKVCSTHPETCDRMTSALSEIKTHRYENAWTTIPKPRGAIVEWLKGLVRYAHP